MFWWRRGTPNRLDLSLLFTAVLAIIMFIFSTVLYTVNIQCEGGLHTLQGLYPCFLACATVKTLYFFLTVRQSA